MQQNKRVEVKRKKREKKVKQKPTMLLDETVAVVAAAEGRTR